ncbi:Septin-5 [Bulinus truncatus]|nr:Septin-5 [Bulinus truncatus]
MVVGESGLGKSTLINSLFLSDLYKDRELPSVNDLVERTVNIEKKQLEIEEKGVRLKLTIVDTPGFNDAVNASNSQKALIEYVDQQFKQYYDDECGLNRRNIVDNRVHCCLYFISPYGHGLRQIDIETMKKLHHKVNIVPLLAKADILTKEELRNMKNRIQKTPEVLIMLHSSSPAVNSFTLLTFCTARSKDRLSRETKSDRRQTDIGKNRHKSDRLAYTGENRHKSDRLAYTGENRHKSDRLAYTMEKRHKSDWRTQGRIDTRQTDWRTQ